MTALRSPRSWTTRPASRSAGKARSTSQTPTTRGSESSIRDGRRNQDGSPMRNQVAGKANLATMAVFFAVASLALVATHGDARACGGLFCNARPPDPFAPLPVAQNGENVVFSITKDPAGGAPTLEAHIQIVYTGDAAKFSWVVPVDAAPTLSTGTDRLFTQLASVTAPRFITSPVIDGNCIPQTFVTGGAGSFG